MFAGCRPAAPVAASPVRHYPVTGTVIGTNFESGEVELDAAAIAGFMDAMIMPYRLADPADLKKLHRGDRIAGTLDVGGSGTVLTGVRVTDATKEIKELAPVSRLQPGQAVPDFALRDQSSDTVHLHDYAGKLLLVTFVYTNCPLSDYCPRMSHQFAEIDKALAGTPLYDRTHLLTISFDPARDTPAALRSYGGAYTGQYTHETFKHWTFAAPRQSDLDPLLRFFSVDAVSAPGGSLSHTLSTVEIGPDGKVLKQYLGNDWTPAQVLADVHRDLGAGA